MGSWEQRVFLACGIVAVIVAIYFIGRQLWRWKQGDTFTIERTSPRKSSVDGQEYRVHEGHLGSQEAANKLAQLNARVISLLRYLRAKYVRGPDGGRFPARLNAVERLLARYNQDNLAENSPRDPSGDTAYSTNKGAIVAICLRNKAAPDELHDIGLLTFVTIHEMTHIAIDATEHPPEFWRTFRFLLEAAEDAHIFTSPRYADHPVNYCGIVVDFSPRWDAKLEPI
jgi:hypothetical protein